MISSKTDAVQSEVKIEKKKNLWWNFGMGLLHGVFTNAGNAFNSPSVILPLFLDNFHLSGTMIGLFSAVFGPSGGGVAGALPQFFVAGRMENKVHKKPLLNFSMAVRTICWGIIALVTYFFSLSNPILTMVSLMFLLLIFTFMGGVSIVPMLDIWGKAIPSNLRGKFFSYRTLLGSIMAVGAGFMAKGILADKSIVFPYNFTLLFSMAFLLMAAASFSLGATKEPEEEVKEKSLPFSDFLTKTMDMIRSHSNFRKFLLVQILNGAGTLAIPFYVLYAKDIMGVSQGVTGFFVVAQIIGGLLSTVIWAHFSDRLGSKRVLEITTFIELLIPITAILLPSKLPLLFVPLFLLVGFSLAGRTVGNSKFSLDIAPQKDRLIYISATGTFKFPIMLYPLLGGIMVQYLSYKFLFISTFILLFFAFILTLKLKEPVR